MSLAETITVRCACGKKLKAPMSAAGRKAGCPSCGATVLLTVPDSVQPPVAAGPAQAVARTAPAPVGGSVSYDDLDSIGESYDVAEEEQAAMPARASLCPNCKSQLNSSAVLCVKCGYDTRTGKALATAAAKPSLYAAGNRGKPQIDMMAPQGSIVLGVVVSALFAVAASVVWLLFAWITRREIGYVAIFIGGAAGMGMQVGHKGYSGKGGVIAATMTVGAILLAKLAVVELIVIPKLGHRHITIFDLKPAWLGLYFFGPLSLLFMALGTGAAFRVANGSIME